MSKEQKLSEIAGLILESLNEVSEEDEKDKKKGLDTTDRWEVAKRRWNDKELQKKEEERNKKIDKLFAEIEVLEKRG